MTIERIGWRVGHGVGIAGLFETPPKFTLPEPDEAGPMAAVFSGASSPMYYRRLSCMMPDSISLSSQYSYPYHGEFSYTEAGTIRIDNYTLPNSGSESYLLPNDLILYTSCASTGSNTYARTGTRVYNRSTGEDILISNNLRINSYLATCNDDLYDARYSRPDGLFTLDKWGPNPDTGVWEYSPAFRSITVDQLKAVFTMAPDVNTAGFTFDIIAPLHDQLNANGPELILACGPVILNDPENSSSSYTRLSYGLAVKYNPETGELYDPMVINAGQNVSTFTRIGNHICAVSNYYVWVHSMLDGVTRKYTLSGIGFGTAEKLFVFGGHLHLAVIYNSNAMLYNLTLQDEGISLT